MAKTILAEIIDGYGINEVYPNNQVKGNGTLTWKMPKVKEISLKIIVLIKCMFRTFIEVSRHIAENQWFCANHSLKPLQE